MEYLREIWAFLRIRKKFWLAPIIVVLLILGLIIAAGTIAPMVSPFIYAM